MMLKLHHVLLVEWRGLCLERAVILGWGEMKIVKQRENLNMSNGSG